MPRSLTRRTALFTSLSGAALMTSPAQAQHVKIKLGTATPGGGFPVYGAAFIEAIKTQDPALEITPVIER